LHRCRGNACRCLTLLAGRAQGGSKHLAGAVADDRLDLPRQLHEEVGRRRLDPRQPAILSHLEDERTKAINSLRPNPVPSSSFGRETCVPSIMSKGISMICDPIVDEVRAIRAGLAVSEDSERPAGSKAVK
jgi:hypothetical protein